MTELFPRRRQDALLIEPVLGELLIYDERTHEAHCLNPTAAAIWQACDGRSSLAVLAARATETTGAPCDETVVARVLTVLTACGLLHVDPLLPREPLSRRELMAAAGMAAAFVTSMTAPKPADAQSGVQGPQGSQGAQGAQGPQGPQG